MINSERIYLRAPEVEDLEVLYAWENDGIMRFLSNSRSPVSRFLLEQYIISSGEDIYSLKQLRLMAVERTTNHLIGHIDISDFDPHHKRACLGIMITENHRNKGYAYEMLQLVIGYAASELEMHQLFCNVMADNQASIKLFEKAGFTITGTKKDWIRHNKKWLDEHLMQLILE